MGAFALVVLEIDPQLLGEHVAHERQIGATSHEAGQLRRPAISIHQRDRKQRTHHQLTVPAELYILPVGVKPGPLLALSQGRGGRGAHLG
jgi:predicted dienelactone hydrolase